MNLQREQELREQMNLSDNQRKEIAQVLSAFKNGKMGSSDVIDYFTYAVGQCVPPEPNADQERSRDDTFSNIGFNKARKEMLKRRQLFFATRAMGKAPFLTDEEIESRISQPTTDGRREGAEALHELATSHWNATHHPKALDQALAEYKKELGK